VSSITCSAMAGPAGEKSQRGQSALGRLGTTALSSRRLGAGQVTDSWWPGGVVRTRGDGESRRPRGTAGRTHWLRRRSRHREALKVTRLAVSLVRWLRSRRFTGSDGSDWRSEEGREVWCDDYIVSPKRCLFICNQTTPFWIFFLKWIETSTTSFLLRRSVNRPANQSVKSRSNTGSGRVGKSVNRLTDRLPNRPVFGKKFSSDYRTEFCRLSR
jgi:hypothetical protein